MDAAPTTPSVRASVIRGTMWMVGAQWLTRGLGLASTAILARLLVPQDFGLMAMATVVAGFLGVLFTFGVDTALIQNANATREHWDTAWSVRILQGLAMVLLLVAVAPAAASFYGEPRVVPIMLLLAGGTLVASFENIGVVAFRKDLAFHRDFQYTLAKKLLQIAVTIPLAFALRTYWALLAGILAGQAFSTAISYAMHPFRPRWSLSRAREIWGFTSRMAFINLSQYMTFEGERIIIGGLTGARETGLYAVANETANVPTTELIGSISRATVPGLAKVKHDAERLKSAYLAVLGMVAVFAVPAGVGIAIVSDDLVRVMLGPQWLDAIPVMQLLAVAGALRATASPLYNLLVVEGRLNAAAIVSWSQTAGQFLLLAPVLSHFGILGAAALNCGLAALTLAFYAAHVVHRSSVSLRDHLSAAWRPCAAAAAMAALCWPLKGAIATPWIGLLVVVAVGAGAYVIVSLALWSLCGRPPGPERQLADMAGARFAFLKALRCGA